MPKRGGHAVNGGPEARRERPVTWQGHPRPTEKPDGPKGNIGKRREDVTAGLGGDGHGTGGCCDTREKPRSHDTSRPARRAESTRPPGGRTRRESALTPEKRYCRGEGSRSGCRRLGAGKRLTSRPSAANMAANMLAEVPLTGLSSRSVGSTTTLIRCGSQVRIVTRTSVFVRDASSFRRCRWSAAVRRPAPPTHRRRCRALRGVDRGSGTVWSRG